MAKVPYSGGVPTVSPGAVAPTSSHRPSPSRAFMATAEATESLGRDMATAAHNLFKIGAYYDEVAADDSLNQFQDQTRRLIYGDPNVQVPGPDGQMQPDGGFMAKRGQDALREWQSVEKRIDEIDGQIKGNLKSDRALRAYQSASQAYRRGMLDKISVHANTEARAWYTSVNSATAVNALTDIAINADNQESVDRYTDDLITARVKNLQLAGNAGDPGMVEQTINGARKDALKAQVQAIAVKEPARALEMLEQNKAVAGVDYDEMANALRARADQQIGIGVGQKAIQDVETKAAQPVSESPAQPSAAKPDAAAVAKAIHTQESGGAPNASTSPAGAVGGWQIMPATFARYAREGERIDNPEDNAAVGQRIVEDLYAKAGGDPARVAVGYFSGEGNIAAPGSPTPWINDVKDATGKSVSSYVGDVMGRLGAPAMATGLVTPGNIDLSKRPVVKNADGSISTVRSMSFEENGKEVLVPTVGEDGRIMSDQEAVDAYHKTGRHLGIFDTEKNATAYAERLHQDQAISYGARAQPDAATGIAAMKAAALQAIMDDKTLTPGAQSAAMSAVRQHYQILDDRRIEEKRAAEERRSAYTSTLEIQVNRGQKSYIDVENAWQNGLISDAKRTEMTLLLDRKNQEKEKVIEQISRADASFNGGPRMDPRVETDRMAVDLHYQMTSASWGGLPQNEVLARAVSYAGQVGMAPTPLKTMIRGSLRSGNSAEAVLAAQTVSQLRNQNPQILNDFNEEDIRLATLIGTYSGYGVPAEKAYTDAIEAMKVSEPERKARASAYDMERGADIKQRDASDRRWLEGKLNSVWTSDPTLDPIMRAEWDSLVRMEYEKTANLDASRQYALDMVNRVWGRTGVGGSERYMKFAPEKFYGVPTMSPADNAEWMNEQLLEDVLKGSLVDPANPIIKDRLFLTPDPTRTTKNGNPVYQVSIIGTDGVFRAVRGTDGRPLPWTPDWETSAAKRREREKYEAHIEDLRRLRAGTTTTDLLNTMDLP